jgi:DNA polymerase family B
LPVARGAKARAASQKQPFLFQERHKGLFVFIVIVTNLIPKYHKYIWYIHNIGNYDIIFIYKVLLEYNIHKGEEYYKMKAICKDNKMLKLTLKVRSKTIKIRYIKITLVDSFNILHRSLAVLSEDLGSLNKTTNLIFLILLFFVTKTRLNY